MHDRLDFLIRKQSAIISEFFLLFFGSRIHVLQVSTGQYYIQLPEPFSCHYFFNLIENDLFYIYIII